MPGQGFPGVAASKAWRTACSSSAEKEPPLPTLARILVGCGLASAVAACGPSEEPSPSPVASLEQAVTTPPSQRNRIGVYNWGVDTTSWNAGLGDQLNWGAGKVAAAGSRTIRVYVGVLDVYHLNGGANFSSMLAAAQSAPYKQLFGSPNFDTYFLTAYTAADNGGLNGAGTWTTGYTQAQQEAETAEISALASWLVTQYSNKTFIFMNWEGDNAMHPADGGTYSWGGFQSWMQSRVTGVRQAQAAHSASASHLAAGLEFNYTRFPSGGGFTTCGSCSQSTACVVSCVAPNVAADFFSYSSYQSFGISTPDSHVASQLESDLSSALSSIQKGQPSVQRNQLMLGEFGMAREVSQWDPSSSVHGECETTQRLSSVISALESWGASYGIYWQVIDNPAPDGPWTGFGLYKYDGTVGLSQRMLGNLYSTGVPTVPSAACDSVNQGGVVNALNYGTHIPQGSIISIFGAGESGHNEDVVHLWANGARYTIRSGSPSWYDGCGSQNPPQCQINATLPSGVVTKEAAVYVSDSTGVDTDAQLIVISPN
jgi:hypothetical protein